MTIYIYKSNFHRLTFLRINSGLRPFSCYTSDYPGAGSPSVGRKTCKVSDPPGATSAGISSRRLVSHPRCTSGRAWDICFPKTHSTRLCNQTLLLTLFLFLHVPQEDISTRLSLGWLRMYRGFQNHPQVLVRAVDKGFDSI